MFTHYEGEVTSCTSRWRKFYSTERPETEFQRGGVPKLEFGNEIDQNRRSRLQGSDEEDCWKSRLPHRIVARGILKQDDIEYAIENTQVILAPERQIATFGNTSFEFHLISQLMDRVDQVRIRTGRIEAERPKILSPEYFYRMMLEGFGEKAQEYMERLREQARQIAVLRYGFQFRKSGVTEETVSASLQSVIDRTRRAVENAGDTNGAIIQGVDEAWEVCLLKFTIEMIERSAGENIGDFKRRGLI